MVDKSGRTNPTTHTHTHHTHHHTPYTSHITQHTHKHIPTPRPAAAQQQQIRVGRPTSSLEGEKETMGKLISTLAHLPRFPALLAAAARHLGSWSSHHSLPSFSLFPIPPRTPLPSPAPSQSYPIPMHMPSLTHSAIPEHMGMSPAGLHPACTLCFLHRTSASMQGQAALDVSRDSRRSAPTANTQYLDAH